MPELKPRMIFVSHVWANTDQDKTIIGIKPCRGQKRIPQIVQDASVCEMVGWSRASIIQAVRDWT